MNRAVDSIWRRPRLDMFGAWVRGLSSDAVVTLAKRDGQLTLEDTSRDGITGTSEAGYIVLSEVVEAKF